MENQKAIEYLEPLTHHPTLTGSYADALKSAVVALREQAERENGCSLCNGERIKNVAIVNHWGEDQIALVSGKVDENEQFVFCPKCGRRLK